jgi:hypothetical protein
VIALLHLVFESTSTQCTANTGDSACETPTTYLTTKLWGLPPTRPPTRASVFFAPSYYHPSQRMWVPQLGGSDTKYGQHPAGGGVQLVPILLFPNPRNKDANSTTPIPTLPLEYTVVNGGGGGLGKSNNKGQITKGTDPVRKTMVIASRKPLGWRTPP